MDNGKVFTRTQRNILEPNNLKDEKQTPQKAMPAITERALEEHIKRSEYQRKKDREMMDAQKSIILK